DRRQDAEQNSDQNAGPNELPRRHPRRAHDGKFGTPIELDQRYATADQDAERQQNLDVAREAEALDPGDGQNGNTALTPGHAQELDEVDHHDQGRTDSERAQHRDHEAPADITAKGSEPAPHRPDTPWGPSADR